MISKRLKSLREDKDLSQKELASILGVSPSTIGMYESEKRTPDSEMLKRIADFFEVSVDYLLGRTSEQKPPTENYKPELNEKDKKDIEKTLNEIKKGSKGKLMLDGEILNEHTEELLWKSIENLLEIAKLNNKAKYTPKKYRK